MNREKRDKNRPTTTYTMNLKTTTPTETTMFFSNATFLFLSSFRTFQTLRYFSILSTVTHIFISLLAQPVVAHIRKGLKAWGWLDESPTHTLATFFDMLRRIAVVDLRVGRKRMAVLSRQARETAPLLKKAFGFKRNST